jgi:ferredoxin
MKYRIVVDPELCIGAAACVTVDPKHFELNDENKALVLDPADPAATPSYERTLEVSDQEKDDLILAAESCPALAISIFDETGKKIFPKEP